MKKTKTLLAAAAATMLVLAPVMARADADNAAAAGLGFALGTILSPPVIVFGGTPQALVGPYLYVPLPGYDNRVPHLSWPSPDRDWQWHERTPGYPQWPQWGRSWRIQPRDRGQEPEQGWARRRWERRKDREQREKDHPLWRYSR